MKTHTLKSSLQLMAILAVTLFFGPASAIAPKVTVLETQSPVQHVDTQSLDAPAVNEQQQHQSEPTLPASVLAVADASSRAADVTGLPIRQPHAGVTANLFAGHSWYTPPPPPPVQIRSEPVFQAPTAPALPFTYIGRYEQEGEDTLFYLVKGDRVYDIKVGDVIDGTYSVDSVSNGQLMFTYLPLNSSQGLRLGDQ